MATTHAVIADFRSRERAANALRALGRAGHRPESVSIIADDPELARDLGGRSHIPLGVLCGMAVGFAFVVGAMLMGGSTMSISPGFVIGAFGVIAGLGFIGLVFGRSMVERSPDAPLFAQEVERGDVLVAVTCIGDTCRGARDALLAAGAVDVREEGSAGPS